MSTLERRLQAEWMLLQALLRQNPQRLSNLSVEDLTFRFRYTEGAGSGRAIAQSHEVRVDYPLHFPAAPMELFLRKPVAHPNVHPLTGFVCLWDRHRVSNTIEHAVHKLAAMLAGHLFNADALHVMQPEALPGMQYAGSHAQFAPLIGVTPYEPYIPNAAQPRRRRLS